MALTALHLIADYCVSKSLTESWYILKETGTVSVAQSKSDFRNLPVKRFGIAQPGL